jgi:hypothetical protein
MLDDVDASCGLNYKLLFDAAWLDQCEFGKQVYRGYLRQDQYLGYQLEMYDE